MEVSTGAVTCMGMEVEVEVGGTVSVVDGIGAEMGISTIISLSLALFETVHELS